MNDGMPYFSIIIPTYNRAYILSIAINSVLNQTFSDWELIVVDDGSIDNTKDLVLAYKDSRIHYIYQENAERSAARNNGINHAKGAYICFLDSDDYFLPERLKKIYDFIIENKNPISLIFSGIIYENKSLFTEREVDSSSLLLNNVFDYLTSIIIATPQICVSATILEEFKFNPKFRFSEDLELCFRIAHKYPIIPQKNNLTIVQLEHEYRTVGYKNHNTSKEQIITWNHILDKNHSGKFISKKYKRWIKGQLFFNEAKYYMFKNMKYDAVLMILKSIVADFKSNQNKHRLYCLFNLLLMKLPQEYSK